MNFNELNGLDDLQFIPANEFKQPLVKDWQITRKKYDLSSCHSVGLVCGVPSGNLYAIDVDEKYSLDGKLFEQYKQKIHNEDDKLLQKLVVQKTRNGGYHLLFRCNDIDGNLKLANRFTTIEERQDTYKKTYDNQILKSVDDDKARQLAQKASDNDKVRVLIETRGKGGFIVCSPSFGYDFIFGDLQSIGEISKDEFEILLSCARQMNEVFEEVDIPRTTKIPKSQGKSPFEDYDERGDVLLFLQNNGWTIVSRRGSKTHLLRAGQTSAKTSGNFDHDKNWFSVFTTSTDFEPQRAYRPYAVFAYLECNKDFSLASKKLYELGFGDRSKPPQTTSTRKIVSRIEESTNPEDFLDKFAKPIDYEPYLQQVKDGTLPQGLTTGMPSLDKYFLFKEGNLVIDNGHDNVGKSIVVWYLGLISAMYHGWNWVIFSSENSLGSFMRKMISFYWGKPISGDYAMTQTEYNTAKAFIEKHFFLIKAEEELYNYKDIILLTKKMNDRLVQQGRKIHASLIDPYNSLKIDLSGFSKLSTHEYHYEALSEIKQAGKANNIGFWLNNHAVTVALRAKDGEKKYPIAPQKADTEGGGKFSNKADDFITYHRLTQHPEHWNITELHVRKIKETETGGRVTPFDEPVKLEMYKGLCAFREKLETTDIDPIDPVMEWHYKNGTIIRPSAFGDDVINKAFNNNDEEGYAKTDGLEDAPF